MGRLPLHCYRAAGPGGCRHRHPTAHPRSTAPTAATPRWPWLQLRARGTAAPTTCRCPRGPGCCCAPSSTAFAPASWRLRLQAVDGQGGRQVRCEGQRFGTDAGWNGSTAGVLAAPRSAMPRLRTPSCTMHECAPVPLPMEYILASILVMRSENLTCRVGWSTAGGVRDESVSRCYAK